MARSFADAIKGTKKNSGETGGKKNERQFAWNVEAKPRVFPVDDGVGQHSQKIDHAQQSSSESRNSKKRKPVAAVNFADIVASRLPPKKKVTPKKTPPPNPTPRQTDTLQLSEFPALSSEYPSSSSKIPTSQKPGKTLPGPVRPKRTSKDEEKTKKNKQRQEKPKTDTVRQSKASESQIDAFFSFKKPLDKRDVDMETGGAGELIRLMRDGSTTVKKGRQRIRQRKKNFSTLKKKVLEERLRRWRKANPSSVESNSVTGNETCTVAMHGFASADELEDDDEYYELVLNLLDMANKVGKAKHAFIHRASDAKHSPAFVQFHRAADATAATGAWSGMVLGGETIFAKVVSSDSEPLEDESAWREWCLAISSKIDMQFEAPSTETVIFIRNAITEDDLEDEECLEESLEDVKEILKKHGEISDVSLDREPSLQLRVTYLANEDEAVGICKDITGQMLGGLPLVAQLSPPQSAVSRVVLKDILTEEDLEDKDCLDESLSDIREIVSKCGVVHGLRRIDGTQAVEVDIACEAAERVIKELNGITIGGASVSASIEGKEDENLGASLQQKVNETEAQPMFSGDKLISERFAECKRVPKIVKPEPRMYASFFDSDDIKPLLIEMLGELMRLQRRAIDEKNTKVKRRLVMGLREVARGIRSRKVRMVVMANNLDDYGVIDEKLQEILNLAHSEDIPVFFEFSKRNLGKAIGKNIKIGVLGVQNAEGAHQQFKKLVNLAARTATRPKET